MIKSDDFESLIEVALNPDYEYWVAKRGMSPRSFVLLMNGICPNSVEKLDLDSLAFHPKLKDKREKIKKDAVIVGDAYYAILVEKKPPIGIPITDEVIRDTKLRPHEVIDELCKQNWLKVELDFVRAIDDQRGTSFQDLIVRGRNRRQEKSQEKEPRINGLVRELNNQKEIIAILARKLMNQDHSLHHNSGVNQTGFSNLICEIADHYRFEGKALNGLETAGRKIKECFDFIQKEFEIDLNKPPPTD